MKPLMRTWAAVDLSAIEQNFRAVQAYTRRSCKIMCVVKADAYGHGSLYVAKTLEALSADYLAVSSVDEAMQLRDGGITLPILILGYTPPEFCGLLLAHDIAQTVYDVDSARILSDIAVESNKKLTVHIKVDTGMSRLGFSAGLAATIDDISAISRLPGLVSEGIFTHFAASDDVESSFTELQFSRFCEVLSALSSLGITFPIRHAANSGATLNFPDTWLDMVRVGILLYGLVPEASLTQKIHLVPAMQLNSSVSQLRSLAKGTPVSYSGTYVAPSDRLLAVLPIGYADGLSRALSNCGLFRIDGVDCPVVGNVCMDMCMVDVTDVPAVKSGDKAVLFGTEGQPIEVIAEICKTINYEVTCLIGKRVLRIYYKEGREVGCFNYISPSTISEKLPLITTEKAAK